MLSIENINRKLQETLSINKYELNFVYLLVFGLLFSFIFKHYNFFQNEETSPHFDEVSEIIYQKLDSIEKADQSTYIGTDEDGNVNTELAKKDTIIKNESPFPQSKKKELPSKLIDLNKATKLELMKLPGVGEKTADVIIEYRKTHPFAKIEDIMNIKGNGPKKFEKMKEFVIVK